MRVENINTDKVQRYYVALQKLQNDKYETSYKKLKNK